MKNILNLLKPAVLIILAGGILTSCHEKGCTNKNALNYNVTADQDDGSCILCTTEVTNLSSKSVYLTDDNFSSPFFNQIVARFDLTEPLTGYTYSECGISNCTLNLTIVNLVNKSMEIQDWEVESFTGPVNVFDNGTTLINVNSSTNLGVIQTFNSPPYFPIAADSVRLFFNNITYF